MHLLPHTNLKPFLNVFNLHCVPFVDFLLFYQHLLMFPDVADAQVHIVTVFPHALNSCCTVPLVVKHSTGWS